MRPSVTRFRFLPNTLSITAVALVALLIAPPSAIAAPTRVDVGATFNRPSPRVLSSAVTFDQHLVPIASHVVVVESPNDLGGLSVAITLKGLAPRTTFDAYVFTHACGPTPASSGVRTLDGPSKQYYPQNEVWLPFTTNSRGAASSRVSQYWTFRRGRANSVVIFSHSPVRAAACVTVPFT